MLNKNILFFVLAAISCLSHANDLSYLDELKNKHDFNKIASTNIKTSDTDERLENHYIALKDNKNGLATMLLYNEITVKTNGKLINNQPYLMLYEFVFDCKNNAAKGVAEYDLGTNGNIVNSMILDEKFVTENDEIKKSASYSYHAAYNPNYKVDSVKFTKTLYSSLRKYGC